MRSKRSTPVRCLRGQPGGRRAEAPLRVDRAGEWGRAAPGAGRAGRPRSRGASSHHSCSSRARKRACRAAALPMRQSRHAWWPFVSLRGSLFFSFVSGKPSPRPPRRGGSSEGETGVFQARCQFLSNPCFFNLLNWFCVTRTQVLFQVSVAPALPGGSYEGETGLFQVSPAPALVCGSYKSETIRNRPSLRDLGIPSRLTSTP